MTSELRRDPLSGSETVVAPGRLGAVPPRPDPGAGLPSIEGPCPFCPGNERQTERAVVELPAEGSWRVRVVPNLYPLVTSNAPDDAGACVGDARPAFGLHEVLIETSAHEGDFPTYEPEHAQDVLWMYRSRLSALERTEGVRAVSVFRNRGRRAGSSQPHPHGQLVATFHVGQELERRADRSVEVLRDGGPPLIDRVLGHELSDGSRVVEVTDDVAVLCAYAPRASFETWIVPRIDRGSFADAHDSTLMSLAVVLGRTIARVRSATHDADYNFLLRNPPVDAMDEAKYWYIEIVPRRAPGAGFELTSGTWVVSKTPEECAEVLRSSA